jgi:drug/metabolite transporter (DMT)-like permease
MRTLWIAMILSIVGYFVFTLFEGPSKSVERNPTLSLVLLGATVIATMVSFLLKSTLMNRAVEQQQVQLVQQGYIVAWAMCEVGGLLGLLDFFVTGDRYYYVLLIIGALGLLIHFPRREHVLQASGKRQIF